MGDAALAVIGGVILVGLVAFRRARGVLTPEARRDVRTRTRSAVTAALTVARVAVGVAALIGIVWVTRQLFR
jgi:hypothetical protein